LSKTVHTLIVGHGDFPEGLVSAAERIVGTQEGVRVISNKSLDITGLTMKIREELGSCDGEVYVFVDLLGGSCFTACRLLMPEHPHWVCIAGVNLPMLVTYLSYRTRLSGEALLRKTLEAAKRGIEILALEEQTDS